MANVIRIPRSVSTNTPASLAQGELAFSESGSPNGIGELFIGVAGPGVQKIATLTGAAAAEPNSSTQDNQILTTGVGISGANAGSATAFTMALDFSELTDMTGTINTGTEFILQDGTTESRKAVSEIGLQHFDNSVSAFSATLGTVTSVTASTGITVAGTGAAPTVAIDYLGITNFIDQAANLEGTGIATGDTIVYHDATDSNVKKGFVSDLPFASGSGSAAGTNTGDVTLAGTPDYITISGQVITRGLIVLTTDVSGDLPFANIAQIATDTFLGRTTAATGDIEVLTNSQAKTALDLTGTNSGDVTLAGTPNYLTISGQIITRNEIDLGTDVTGNLPVTNLNGGTSASITTFWRGDGAWATPAGSGDVSGPGAAVVADRFVTWNGTSGTLIKDSTYSFLDSDTMTGASATTISSSESIKAYVDTAVTGALTHKGGYNASTNTPALDTGSPVLELGDMYTVTAAGTFFTVVLEIGDVLISDVDSVDAAAVGDWTIVQKNLVAASITEAGYVTVGTQTFGGTKTFEDIAGNNAGATLDSFIIDGGTF